MMKRLLKASLFSILTLLAMSSCGVINSSADPNASIKLIVDNLDLKSGQKDIPALKHVTLTGVDASDKLEITYIDGRLALLSKDGRKVIKEARTIEIPRNAKGEFDFNRVQVNMDNQLSTVLMKKHAESFLIFNLIKADGSKRYIKNVLYQTPKGEIVKRYTISKR